MLWLRSLLFSIFFIGYVPIASSLCIPALLLPLKYRHGLVRFFLGIIISVLTVLCGIRYTVKGLENIPKDRTGVILSKHQSAWETFLLPLLFHEPAAIVKRELLWVPFFGWGLAVIEPIVINRKARSSAMQQIIAKVMRALKEGRWVLIFPEGTRTAMGQVGQYKLGGARLAVAAECPVIPVAHNAGRFWPKRKFTKQPGIVQVVIGPPIESAHRTPEEVMQLAKTWIEETMQTL